MDNIYPMNLQLFAEGDAAAESGAAEVNTAETTADESGDQMIPKSEVEKIINARFAKLQRESEKWVEQARKDGMTEGEKLANMSAEERFKAQQEKAESDMKAREDALKQREAEVARKELRAQAVETLNGKELPAELADILVYTDAEACNASIAVVESAWRKAVKAEVDKRLAASSVPPTRSSGGVQQEADSDAVRLAKNGAKAKADAREKSKNIISKYM